MRRTPKTSRTSPRLVILAMPRRFPPPWSVDEPDVLLQQSSYIVRYANGQVLAYIYFEED